jgi:hypothetical protein
LRRGAPPSSPCTRSWLRMWVPCCAVPCCTALCDAVLCCAVLC